MIVPTLNLTETQAFQALRSFILNTVDSTIEVVRGYQNRVGEPQGDDFIVVWPLLQTRLSTNYTTSVDNSFTGYITDNVLTVTEILTGFVAVGQLLFDKDNDIEDGTSITGNITVTAEGLGQYSVSIHQDDVLSSIIYDGIRNSLVPTQWSAQLDIHGPNSANSARIIEGLFRSEYGVDAFSGTDVTPLYCDEARFLPFINAEQQIEYRWTLDLQLQLNPVIGTPEQFFDKARTTSIPVDIIESI